MVMLGKFLKLKKIRILILSVLTASLLGIVWFFASSIYIAYNAFGNSRGVLYSLKPSSIIFYNGKDNLYKRLSPYFLNNVPHDAFYYAFIIAVVFAVVIISGMFFYFYKLISKQDDLELSLSSVEKSVLEVPSLIFHEIRNNINAISVNSKLLNVKLEKIGGGALGGPAGKPGMEDIQSGIKKIGDLIESETSKLNLTMENIVRITKNYDLVLEDTDIRELVKEAVDAVTSKAGHKGVKLNCKAGERVIVTVDKHLMKHVLINLISNAVDSYDDTSCDFSKDVYIYYSFYLSKLMLVVRDNGRGMSGESLKRVYEPFYTTKKNGIGLGLPIVKKIIDAHGFSMSIESYKGKGTTVSLILGHIVN